MESDTEDVPNAAKPNPDLLKRIISTSDRPLIFQNILNWDLLNWDTNEWVEVCGEEMMPFRCGKYAHTKDPQWEHTTSTIEGTLKEFFDYNSDDEWVYFDYKYLKDWLMGADKLKTINWHDFGFPEITFKESTIWIGSKGAHTPCHIDTYGCNLIAQIYGSKQWVVFPPEENLQPTRVPYEESSVYSKLNFFTPDLEKFKGIGNGYKLILNPGDVLFLPHNWWHYVENLETAISINAWLPLPADNEKRVEEAITQMLMSQFIKGMTDDESSIILNPNEKHVEDKNFINSANTIKLCIDNCNACKISRKKMKTSEATTKSNIFDENIVVNYSRHIKTIEKMGNVEFRQWLEEQRAKVNGENLEIDKVDTRPNFAHIIEACTHPDVIELIKIKLLSKYATNND